MSSRRPTSVPLLMSVAVVAVSMSGPVMAGLAVPALAISFWRNGLATLLISPVALLRHRAELAALDRRTLGTIVLAGLCLAAHFAFWVTSLTMTSVASSTAIVCLQVVWVVAWDRTRGIRLPWPALLGVGVALAGAVEVGGVDFTLSSRALLGDVFALIGSIAVAAYTVIGAGVRRTTSTTVYTFCCYGTAALTLLVVTVASGHALVGYAARDWALLVLVTLTSQLLGHSVFNHLLATTSPMLVSIALLLEIPGATLLAAFLLGQVPPAGAFAGLVLVLVGMGLVVLNPPAEAPTADTLVA